MKFKGKVVHAECESCDGRGWMDLDEFREFTDHDGLLGDDHERVFGKQGFYLSICPDCDGFGDELDPDDDIEDDYLIAMIDRINNHRGFRSAFIVDFEKRKLTRVIEFQWRQRSWRLFELPTRKFSTLFE